MEKITIEVEKVGSISDGYHTFDELYDHRITLWVAFCRRYIQMEQVDRPWRSKLHADGSAFEGWFILGLKKEPGEQITYHLPLSRWDQTNWADTFEKAPEWDGHTANDVLERLKKV